ncbi:MAG: TIGR03619 family F420-dependent LLM class oxidoreductase [Deltaproteobacteria bacterium]|nr:MAG: TIGR03619 family F420-dependent LLM class oxidoreductase [Deltaproteobacteria bacterium]
MRFSYAESMCDPSHYLPLAVEAESSGWSSFVVPDSICYPEVSDSKYPYTPDGSREFLEDKPFLEPFSLIPAMGAVTQRLRFATFVVKLPIRNPVLVAKSASSVAVLTQNRFTFGVGLSPWPEDYAICGQAWKARGRRMDEMIEIVRGLTRGGFFEYRGEHYDLQSIKLCPVPTEPIPILIGGHADAALRRAARCADGWMHAGGDAQELARLLGRLAELRREHGRSGTPFEIHVIALDAYTRDGIRRLEDLGVTDVIVGFRNAYEKDTQSLQQKIDALRRYADDVIARS